MSEEPLPVRLLSTIWADGDGLHDDLRAPSDLDRWLDAVGLDHAGAPATEAELGTARALRDAIRLLAAYVTADRRPAPAPATAIGEADVTQASDRVNAIAAQRPPQRLALDDGRLALGRADVASPVTIALAQIAEEAIALFGGADAGRLRACYAPGCVLYFVKSHPRREWCSVACGNRVRAARHYHRGRAGAARAEAEQRSVRHHDCRR
jgi:predicted RNA-binding Zn ribbon-like protein